MQGIDYHENQGKQPIQYHLSSLKVPSRQNYCSLLVVYGQIKS